MDKIQMTEKQAIKLIEDCFCLDNNWNDSFNRTVKYMKDFGYIKQTDLEKAKEDYCTYIEIDNFSYKTAHWKLTLFKDELEIEIKRLKGETK